MFSHWTALLALYSIKKFIFRDHKFEWTRSEFQNWVQGCIIEKFPDYIVERFDGVGDGPAQIGECSQLVVLVRKDFKIASQNGEYDNITLEEDDVTADHRCPFFKY